MEQIGNTKVYIENGYLEKEEVQAYISHLEKKFPTEEITSLTLTVDGEYVDMKYTLRPASFERIRRITGYLVGTLDRFNDAKASEESQRIKHSI